ncbi:hypothetical protein GOODEAATRI_027600 [Goodea atripinnis]|uniref:Secreted protein n=1 Tax=Goodea atripinnis TaxID=208336 RepID=A0ABV0PS62_9TELE
MESGLKCDQLAFFKAFLLLIMLCKEKCDFTVTAAYCNSRISPCSLLVKRSECLVNETVVILSCSSQVLPKHRRHSLLKWTENSSHDCYLSLYLKYLAVWTE